MSTHSNKSMNHLGSRLWQYQKERFPVVLIVTTFAVVLSSAAIVLPKTISYAENTIPILIATITGYLFMFTIRAYDEFKDHHFDNEHHKYRPVQRGLISLQELDVLNWLGLLIQSFINAFTSAFWWWVAALAYTLFARAEFFVREWIRKHFIFYNIVSLLQIFFLQIYVYAVIYPQFSWANPLIYAHFAFVLLNAGILEMGRKMFRKETSGKDSYSDRFGFRGAALGYAWLITITFILYINMAFYTSVPAWAIWISVVALILKLLSIIFYVLKKSESFLQVSAIVFYLVLHFAMAVGG